jgi:SHS2 domain-containing protein
MRSPSRAISTGSFLNETYAAAMSPARLLTRGMGRTRRGHRSLPHTADVMVEAWGPDLAACCEEAVAGLVETYTVSRYATVFAEWEQHVTPAPAHVILVEILDEVVFALDVAEGVPIRAHVQARSDGALKVRLALADPATIQPAGAVPKAISRSGL